VFCVLCQATTVLLILVYYHKNRNKPAMENVAHLNKCSTFRKHFDTLTPPTNSTNFNDPTCHKLVHGMKGLCLCLKKRHTFGLLRLQYVIHQPILTILAKMLLTE